MAAYWDPISQPYAATFWFTLGCSVFGLALVPFLTIGMQGGKAKAEAVDSAETSEGARTEEVEGMGEKQGEDEATVTADAPAPAQVLPAKA